MATEAKPVITTVAFTSRDKDAFNAFWSEISDRYAFCKGDDTTPTQAFAVSIGDMFAEQEAIDLICDSSLDSFEKVEAISAVAGCFDIPALLAEWEVERRA